MHSKATCKPLVWCRAHAAQETEALQAEVRVLEEARSRLTRELGLKTDLEAGYAARGARQATALKESQARISALEGSLQNVMADFDRERQVRRGGVLLVASQGCPVMQPFRSSAMNGCNGLEGRSCPHPCNRPVPRRQQRPWRTRTQRAKHSGGWSS